MMGAKSHADESSGPAEPSLPHQQAVDMTAPETFTTAPRQPLTKGRRPDMTAICANATWRNPARVDVNRTLADRDGGHSAVAFGRIVLPAS